MTQSEALDILKLGHTTFITGSAGAGKTHLLNQFINYLKQHKIKHAITASTGIAATHVNGSTIHSWSGIGVKDNLSEWDMDMMLQKEKLVKRYNETQVLIIDEISMLHASRLDMLNQLCKFMRNNPLPFGGMQVVFCGDFFQLPPVVRDKNISLESEYAFNSKAWKESKPVVCYLTENYRQEDNFLLNILNMIRSGDEDIYDNLEALNDTAQNELENAISLQTHNEKVNEINNKHYESLDSDVEHVYDMVKSGQKKYLEQLLPNILAEETLRLKVNTKVIFIKNDNKFGKYQNGTLGVVTGFTKNNSPIVKLTNDETIIVELESWSIKNDDDKLLAEVSQFPLKHAWAITIHKSQGMTLDQAHIDLSRGFGFGMGYVALSRVRSLSGLKIEGLNNQALMMSPTVIEENNTFIDKSNKAKVSLSKYSKAELNDMQLKVRLKMGGTENPISDEELKEIDNKSKIKTEKIPTEAITLNMIIEGNSIEDIIKTRELTLGTILTHIENITSLATFKENEEIKNRIISLVENYYKKHIKANIKNASEYKKLLNKKTILEIRNHLELDGKLKPVYEKYSKTYDGLNYDTLRLIKLLN